MLILTLFNRLFIYFRKLDHENLIEAVTVVYPSIIISPNENNIKYLKTKKAKLNHCCCVDLLFKKFNLCFHKFNL